MEDKDKDQNVIQISSYIEKNKKTSADQMFEEFDSVFERDKNAPPLDPEMEKYMIEAKKRRRELFDKTNFEIIQEYERIKKQRPLHPLLVQQNKTAKPLIQIFADSDLKLSKENKNDQDDL